MDMDEGLGAIMTLEDGFEDVQEELDSLQLALQPDGKGAHQGITDSGLSGAHQGITDFGISGARQGITYRDEAADPARALFPWELHRSRPRRS